MSTRVSLVVRGKPYSRRRGGVGLDNATEPLNNHRKGWGYNVKKNRVQSLGKRGESPNSFLEEGLGFLNVP